MMGVCLDCNSGTYRESIRCRKCEAARRKGANNPMWNGGRQISSQGYVYVNHDGRMVREHRLVMELHIGRELLPTETVHHINGNKTDNRLENLELWASVHPKGQRVSDLVKFAREILDRYDEVV